MAEKICLGKEQRGHPRKESSMKEKKKIVSATELGILVGAACALLVLLALLIETIPNMMPLYAGMVAVLLYLAFFAFFIYRRQTDNAADEEAEKILSHSDVKDWIAAITSPALLLNEQEQLLWCNQTFVSLVEQEPKQGVAFSSLCPAAEAGLLYAKTADRVVSLGGRLYACRGMQLPMEGCQLLVLEDVSDLHDYCRRITEDQTAVAYVVIDNIEELLQYIQEKFRSAATEVEEILRGWAASMNGVIRSYERDKYLMFFDYRHLKECVASRFSILDEIRSVRVGDGMPVTVSVGVACIKDTTLAFREQMAQAALDMALQRGGDQVVYRSDEGTEFYGGKTKAVHKRANVKARVIGTAILGLIGRADNVLIMGHQYGDYDSFGASVGMARLAMFAGVKVNIVVERSDFNLRPCFDRIAACEEYDDVFVTVSEAPSLVKPGTLLIVVDVNNIPNTACPALYEMVKTTVIVDHHTKSENKSKEPTLAYIEPSASSASEMVAEMLEQNMTSKRLLREEAELMLSGILLDTKQLTKSTGTRTYGAAQFLRGEGASPSEAHELFKTDVQDMVKQAKFMSHVLVYKETLAIAVCDGDTDASYRVIAAKAADSLLTGKGIHASFALVPINGKVHISARSDGTVNVAKILEDLHGGGHFDAAGAQVEEVSGEATIERLKKAIDKYLV